MTDLAAKTKLRILNVTLGIAVGGILLFLILYETDLLIINEAKNFDFNSVDARDPNQLYKGTLLLTSKSFSEYSHIDVEIDAYVANGTLYDTLYVIFPLSHNVPYEPGYYGTMIGGGWVELKRTAANYYEGHGRIEYQVQGAYWFGVTYDLPDETVGPQSEKADNLIIIKEKGAGLPSMTDRVLVASALLTAIVGIIFGRQRLLKHFFQSDSMEQNKSTKSGKPKNNTKSAKSKNRSS